MGLITQSIPTLLRGVSQASDTQQQSDHAWMQSNFVSSPTEGLKKRSGAQYVATLQSSTMGNVHIQTINRNENESYIAVFGNKSIKVFDAKDGTEKNIVFDNTSADNFNYLIRDALPSQEELLSGSNFIAGTYSQSGTTVTVTSNSHGLKTGDAAGIDITSGTGVDGDFTITVTSANTFTYTAATSLTTNGIVYFWTSNPKEEFKTISVADHAFVLNTNKTVAMTADVSTGANNGALVFFNQVSDNTNYTITVNNTIAVHPTSSDNPLSTTTIATGIKDKLLGQNGKSPDTGSALTGFTISQNGPVLWIKKDDSTDFGIDANDTQGDSQITLVKNSTQNFTDLPVVAPNNFVVEVKGSDSTKFDNHYVKFVTNNGGTFEKGQWEETVKPGISYKFDYATMPYVLVRKRDGDFIFSQADGGQYSILDKTVTYSLANHVVTVTSTAHGLSTGDQIEYKVLSGNIVNVSAIKTITVTNANTFTFPETSGNFSVNQSLSYGLANTETLPKWGERTVGDLDTAPNPSFVGQKINNIFFFRNRLGVLSDDDVILSRVGDYFNFFPETVTTVLDSDPIDIAASHTKISILKHAITMGEELILFSEKAQFTLKASDDTLTPKTAYIVVSTEFDSNTKANPVSSGNSIYFLTQKGEFSGIREYIKQPGVEIKDASDITIHIPAYIPSSVFKMTTSSSENLLALLPQDSNDIYINRWLYGEDFNKVLNSWFALNLYTDYNILNIDFIGSDLFLVVESATETVLLKLPFKSKHVEPYAPGGEDNSCEFHLDFKVTEATTGVSITYDSNTKLSTFTFPYKLYGTPKIVGRFLDRIFLGGTDETSTYVDSKGNTKTLDVGETIETSTIAFNDKGTTSVVTATGDYRNSKVIMGYEFSSMYVFSTQKLIDQKTNAPILGGRFQLLNFYLKYERTAFFETSVSSPNGGYSRYKFTPNLLGVRHSTGSTGSATQPLSKLRTQKGVFKFPVMAKADMTSIEISNRSFLPAQFLSAEYEAMYHSRSRRI